VSVLTLVFTFESSAALAFAFGMAVTGTITITTLLFFYYARNGWRVRLWVVALAAVPLLTVDLLFLAANLTKLVHGAWLPLLIAVVVFTVLTTWHRGRQLVTARREHLEGPLRAFVDELHDRTPPVLRAPGCAVFLNRDKATAPLAMRASVDRLHALNEHVVILSIETMSVPHVPPSERLVIDDLGYGDDGIAHATARFGYIDEPNVPAVVRQIAAAPIEFRFGADEASYFLSTIDLTRGDEPGLSRWRKTLFLATASVTADAAEYFRLPRDRTVILGSRIEV